MQGNTTNNLTLLKPGTLLSEIEDACMLVKENQVANICVCPLFVKTCKLLLHDSTVQVATVINYPYGYAATEVKLAEVLLALLDGADLLYVTVNVLAVKNGDWKYVANEIKHLQPVITSKGKIMKMVVDTGVLTLDELEKCVNLHKPANIDFLELDH